MLSNYNGLGQFTDIYFDIELRKREMQRTIHHVIHEIHRTTFEKNKYFLNIHTTGSESTFNV